MPIVNEDDVEPTEVDREDARFERRQLGAAAGSERLGCSLYELPAGSRAWPYHYHEGNEEAIYVLSGEGSIRLDGQRHSLTEGDYVALPAGEASAHRVVNDSDGPLRYLALSTMDYPDVLIYPDTEKVGVYVGSAPGDHEGREFDRYYRIDEDVDYWE